jgi:hypothetical protein
MKIRYTIILGLIFILLIAFSCNKDKRYSKQLMRGETWRVSQLEINGASQEVVRKLVFSTCDIYEEYCQALWIASNNDTTTFYWQINEKGKEFRLMRYNDADSCCTSSNTADYYCFQLSGNYSLVESKRKIKIIESTTTVGYSGSTVRMVLEREG